MRRLWPCTEFVLAVFVMGSLIGWYLGGDRLLDAVLGRPPLDERLITAAATMNGEAFDAALAAGARPSGRDPNGMTALAYAAITGNEARVSRLLAAGADINVTDKWGFTPLIHAAEYDRGPMVRFLLEHGADPQLRSHRGETASDRARLRESQSALAALTAHDNSTVVAQLESDRGSD